MLAGMFRVRCDWEASKTAWSGSALLCEDDVVEYTERAWHLRPCKHPQPVQLGVCAACSFWDTLSFSVNGIVFFFAGASAVNFFVR